MTRHLTGTTTNENGSDPFAPSKLLQRALRVEDGVCSLSAYPIDILVELSDDGWRGEAVHALPHEPLIFLSIVCLGKHSRLMFPDRRLKLEAVLGTHIAPRGLKALLERGLATTINHCRTVIAVAGPQQSVGNQERRKAKGRSSSRIFNHQLPSTDDQKSSDGGFTRAAGRTLLHDLLEGGTVSFSTSSIKARASLTAAEEAVLSNMHQVCRCAAVS